MTREPTFENALAFAGDLIRIPSMSGEEGEVAARLREEMRALGFDRVEVDGLGSVAGVVKGRGDAPPVMLSCHLDVVAEGDHDEWEHPPFGGDVADGFLHGRGAMDIKGPMALQVYAAAALAGRAPGDVIVGQVVYEERGGWGMENLVRSGLVRPAAVIIGESTHGDIAIGHRGRSEVEVVAHGVAGHASAPDRARNALDLLPAILAGVRDLADRHDGDAVLGPSSVVATGVDAVPASLNVIPDRVTVTLDWRILPRDTTESLLARVRESLRTQLARAREATWPGAGESVEVRIATERQRTYTGVEEARRMFSPGFLMDPSDPVVTAAARAVGKRGGNAGPARVRPWTFATDGGWTRGVRGIPTIGFAPGEERHAHTNTERLHLEEARWGYAKYLDLVPAVQGVVGAGSVR